MWHSLSGTPSGPRPSHRSYYGLEEIPGYNESRRPTKPKKTFFNSFSNLQASSPPQQKRTCTAVKRPAVKKTNVPEKVIARTNRSTTDSEDDELPDLDEEYFEAPPMPTKRQRKSSEPPQQQQELSHQKSPTLMLTLEKQLEARNRQIGELERNLTAERANLSLQDQVIRTQQKTIDDLKSSVKKPTTTNVKESNSAHHTNLHDSRDVIKMRSKNAELERSNAEMSGSYRENRQMRKFLLGKILVEKPDNNDFSEDTLMKMDMQRLFYMLDESKKTPTKNDTAWEHNGDLKEKIQKIQKLKKFKVKLRISLKETKAENERIQGMAKISTDLVTALNKSSSQLQEQVEQLYAEKKATDDRAKEATERLQEVKTKLKLQYEMQHNFEKQQEEIIALLNIPQTTDGQRFHGLMQALRKLKHNYSQLLEENEVNNYSMADEHINANNTTNNT
jgi:outer membrane murein-binding lipoprotein Lpp